MTVSEVTYILTAAKLKWLTARLNTSRQEKPTCKICEEEFREGDSVTRRKNYKGRIRHYHENCLRSSYH